ncbi:helix-turn-helix domain-containing protein [Streptosporangium sp. NPDC006007]|uniref:helix-turn-helix domain-containing protein n=1 Tax=Streptosporangium sp. NPDC006007 TaxID=3154575 RepID=UPI0033B9F514
MSAERLAELLSELKLRGGRTYEALGRRTGMSRSTVHRYCRGEIVPDSYGPLERIARACGADKAELGELYRLWAKATASPGAEAVTSGSPAESDVSGQGGMSSEGDAAGKGGAATAPVTVTREPALALVAPAAKGAPVISAAPRAEEAPAVSVTSPVRSTALAGEGETVEIGPGLGWGATEVGGSGVAARRPRWAGARQGLAFLSAALAVACLTVLTASTPPPPPSPVAQPQWITGPAWTKPPALVPRTLFGVTMNSSTGTMPAFRVGAVRLWDSETRWAQIQPERGEYDWSVLERLVTGAHRAGLPVLFVLGGTPGWASPGGPAAPYPDGSKAAPPDDLADWDTFVRALVGRYRGRIAAYELWVLGNDRRFYAGTVETLVEMTRRASVVIRRADPKATVVCPGMGRLWTPEGRSVLRRFAELGGYDHCDVAGIKLHQRTASDPPESMLELATMVDRTMHKVGIQPRLWSTGTTYSIPLERPLDETRARNYAVRFFLTGLWARNVNLERMYFYNWGGTKIPIVLQAEGGAPTRAALAVEQLQRWLAHAHSRSCGRGLAINLPENVWQCEFTVIEPDWEYTATIRWAFSGTADTTAGPNAHVVRRLDGATVQVRPGDTITVTEEPVLIEDRP